MNRYLPAIALLLTASTLACGKDPARDVKIIERPAAPAPAPPPAEPTPAPSPSGTPPAPSTPPPAVPPAADKPSAAAAFRLPMCPPLPEESGGKGTLTVSGPCAFVQRGPASCEALADDFIMVATRKAKGGATLMVYVNVENYTGPKSYKDAQMFIGVQDKVNIWRWSSDAVAITVGAGETFADLHATRLEAEPVLVNCTGPMTNFQCEGRGDDEAFNNTVETLSGRLECEPAPKQEK